MCGIAGVIGSDAVPRVRKMLDKMAHRGPDGEGLWHDHPNLALGHKRLAIVDLSPAGRQPMVSRDGLIVIAVNGEIYNYPELRRDLEKLGARFNSTSDSEVVIHAWQHWGKACLAKFNGMFAFALYDRQQDELILARDRLGIKPLYYSVQGRNLLFASEIKAIVAACDRSAVGIDPIGLNQYLTYQNYFGSRSLHADVKMLQPGQMLSLTPGGNPRVEAFWSLSFDDEEPAITFTEAVERYRQVVSDAVKRHLMSDVPVASYLSAGFDSATVANRAAQAGALPVCFTGSFTEGGWYDETSVAREMAHHNGSEHIAVSIGASDLPRVLDRLIAALDEPRMGMGAFPQYCVAERVAATHKVVLTGHGGDELFSGYPVFKLVQTLENLTKAPFGLLYHLRGIKLSELPHLAYFTLGSLKSNPYRQYLPVLNSAASLQQGLKSEWSQAINGLRAEDELIALDKACENRMQVLYSHYLQAYLNGLLLVEDKLSMAHSLESRTPMLDNKVLELSLTLPQTIKLNAGQLKAVIKAGGQSWLPESLYRQPKRGFPTPLRFWLRGRLREWFVDRMTGDDSGLQVLFREDWLRQTCDRYLYSYRRHLRPLDEIQSHKMWQLLSLESYLRNIG